VVVDALRLAEFVDLVGREFVVADFVFLVI